MNFSATISVEATPRMVAEMLAAMNDEQQAQVFIELAEIARGWDHGPAQQFWDIGKHLRTCSCATEEARDLIRDIHSGIEGEGRS